MKKALIVVLSIFIISVSLDAKIGQFFKDTTKKAGKTAKGTSKKVKKTAKKAKKKSTKVVTKAKSSFKNPTKIAQDAGKTAVKSMGVNVQGIQRDVRIVQRSAGRLSTDAAVLQREINAPASPKSKMLDVLRKIKEVQVKAQLVEREVGAATLRNALSSPAGVRALGSKLTSDFARNSINSLANAYSALITELDSIQTVPLLSAVRATILSMAGTVDAVLRIRSNAGKLAEIITAGNTINSLGAISGSLHRIADDLEGMIKAGGMRKIGTVQGELIAGVISNLNKFGVLSRDVSKNLSVMVPNMTKIRGHVAAMIRNKNSLVTAANSLSRNLNKAIENKSKTVIGAASIPAVAIQELRSIIQGMRDNIDDLLLNLSRAIDTLADNILAGNHTAQAFKTNINFDLIAPKGRPGFEALPDDVRGLAGNVNRLRRSLR